MSLELFFETSFAIQLHIVAALVSAIIGVVVFLRRKGTWGHKAFGRVFWVTMMVTALSSFFIHEIKLVGNYSPIHLLSIYVVVSLFYAIYMVRRGNILAHKRAMIGLYVGGIVIAGGFTFMPGRLMARMTYGGAGGQDFPILALFSVLAVAVVLFAADRIIDRRVTKPF